MRGATGLDQKRLSPVILACRPKRQITIESVSKNAVAGHSRIGCFRWPRCEMLAGPPLGLRLDFAR